MHAASVHPEPGSNSWKKFVHKELLRVLSFALYSCVWVVQLVYSFSLNWRDSSLISFLALYLFIVVQFSRTDLSLLRNLSLTACILYHILQRLSRPFCKVFRFFSQTLSSAPSFPCALLSDPLGCDLIILSHLLRFVKCFFKISHRLFFNASCTHTPRSNGYGRFWKSDVKLH